MKCREARGLILSDNLDGRLERARQNLLDRHLSSCAACGELHASARKYLSGIFDAAQKDEPPAYVWERIKQDIESGPSQGAPPSAYDTLRGFVSGLLRVPRPVMAFATTAVIIIGILAAIPVIRTRALDNYLGEQADFMERLGAAQINGDDFFDTDININVENFI